MNKIYKVIWSKVKHQYVVVSELAHSNGKQSRTAKRSLRSRIAALVVCGAIAAFGVFGVTEQQAFAGIGQAVEAQYVAIAVDDSNDNGRNNRRFSFDRESYNYHKETLPGTNTTYWVRDGYSIKLEYGYRFPQSQGAADNKQIVAYKTDANADTGGLLQSNQVMIDTSSTSSGEPVTTYTGSILNDVEVGTYVGAVNTSSTETPATFNYYIEDDNGKYIDAGGNPDMGEENHFDERFVEATLNADGSYTVNIDGKNQVVSRDNLYVINDKYKDISGREHDNYKIGVFTTTSNQIYTGRVFGKHNEVLMTAQDKDGNYYSYWAANTDDPNAPLTGMTIGQFNTSLKEIDTNSRKLAGDDIKQIDVTSTGENKGTIGLLRRGTYNEATGEWEGNTYAPGTINITSEAKTGEDTKIRFANEANPDGFTVDAGSRVVGKTGADGTTEANPNDTLTGIEINGQNYKLGGGKIYTDGDGIAIDDENDNKISVRLKDDETNLTVDDTGLALNKDLTVDSVNAKGTTIDEKGLTVGGTTYVSAEGLSAGNKVITNVADGAIDSDAVNLGQLKDVEEKADDAVEVAGKHTIVSTEDNNLTVENVAEEGQAANYEVALNKDLTVDSVNAKGTTIDENGLTVGGTTYVSKEGLNAGGKAITNVANGVIDSDAVNLGQLKDVEEKADDAVDEAGKHTIVSTEDNNLKVENVAEEGQAANYEVALNKDLAVDSVTAGGTTISSTGLTAGKVNVDATTDTVSGLSNISWDSQKADEGYYKNSTKAATEAQLSAVNTTANKGWSLYITDKDGKQTLVKDVKPTNPLVSIDSGENVSITRNEDGNGLTISADLKDLDVEDTNAVLYDKDTNKTSVTLAGGESGTQIHNLADGTKDTDAVNLGQLTDKTGDLQYNTNHYVTNDEDLTISIGKLDNQVFTNTTNITELQNSTIDSGNVDEKGNINLTHTNADNTTTTIASIDGLKDYALKDGQYITKDKSGATLLTLQDQYDPNNTKTVKIDGLATYNIKTENGEVTGIDYGNIRLAGEIARDPETGEIIIDPKTGKEINTGTRITNLKAGYVGKESTDAVNGSQLYAVQQEAGKHTTVTVNGGVEAPEDGSYTNKDGHLDGNLLLKQTNNDGQIQYDIKLNPDVNLTGEGENSDNRVWLSGSNGTITVTTENNLSEKTTVINGGNVYVGSSVSVGDKVEITDKDITGLSNTSWNGTTDDESRAATEGQLKDVSDTVNAGWTATDSNGASIVVNSENGSTLNFAGDRNIEVKANEKDGSIDVSLKDDIVLGGKEDTSRVEIGGTNGTIMATKDPNSMAATTTIDGGNVYVGSSISVGDKVEITDKDITGLSNTEWNGTTTTPDRAATEGQLQDVAIEAAKHTTVSGDKNITVKHEEDSQDYQVTLNDKVYLGGDHTEDSHNIVLDGDRGVIGLGSTIALDGRDGTAVIGGVNITTTSEEETGKAVSTITGLSNTTWEGTTETPDRAATEGQLQSVATEAAKHTTVSGDENITVKHEEGSQDYQVTLNPDVTLKGDNSSIELNGTKGTMQVNQETAEGTNFTNINGNVVSIGYTNSEGIENAIVIDGGKGTITGLSNTTWDDELAKQVANSEELQGTAATQGQLQQAVNEVAEVANAGWNAKAGGNTINVKPNETLNFEGDGNITVSATSGTSSELKFGLNHNITLDNVKDKNTMLVINTDGREGYIPDNYKDSNEDAEDFIGKHGGFAIYYANPSLTTGDMTGTFGVTTDGVVHAKDVISYYSASSGSQSDVIRYSLNDVGDIVTQISHAVFDEGVGKTGMEYTLISDFEDEADKDSPFDAKEGKTRTIGLAVRQDGAVIVGAVVNDEGISRDRGIRINAETKTTYDKNGNEVTNNIATITGLENTEWKPPTPVATLAANDGSATVTSRAATESQLNDLYSAVAAYDVNVDGTIDYSHIALAGTPYGASRSGNGTPTGGTSITNVAYASGKDGSEAVNVDYLNDAINNAVKDGGAISDSDRHLQEGTYHVNDQGKVELIVADEKGENQSTVTIDNIANKNDITNLDNKIDNTFNDLNDKINNIDNVETDVKGGNINEDGTISLKTENEDGTTTNVTLKGQLTDSGVVQEGTTFDKETGTLTITSQDKYSGETSSVTVEGIASTEVVGATTKEDLATAYKDADKDGNATTEYITDSESMVEADVALDHAIQDVAGTSYANDMVLSNRIDSVEKRLGNVEERIDKVGAMAAAIANLRTMGFDPEAPTEIAIGVGQYKSETGIAIGVFHYPNQDFMLSASLSSSGDELMGGIGATWKLGRKSAAERAKDEEARHLEQAEEMKKLAQQEKVKAQAQRHAKLLAERQQASQKNA